MALRDQPYLPLYVQDFLTDEKLIECSAESTGVYIRLLCILHKSEEYGKLLLKQKDKHLLEDLLGQKDKHLLEDLLGQKDKHLLKQGVEQIHFFSLKLLKQMPYTIEVIEKSLTDLFNEGVIQIEDDILYQKRMVKDNIISLKRAKSGKKGGDKTKFAYGFATDFARAKVQANTENENEYNNKEIKDRGVGEDYTEDFLSFWKSYPKKSGSKKAAFDVWKKLGSDRPGMDEILSSIMVQKGWRKNADGEFRPEWKDPERWLKNRMWESDFKTEVKKAIGVPKEDFLKCLKCGTRTFRGDLNEAGVCIKCEGTE
jgi:hypothetical protein